MLGLPILLTLATVRLSYAALLPLGSYLSAVLGSHSVGCVAAPCVDQLVTSY